MVINNNILSTRVLNYYNQSSGEMDTAMRHLSTGSRIPSVVEGISDYAIAKKMQIQIGILQQGINHAQINRAMLETAFEGIENQREMLNQIRDIALKAMDDTCSNADRSMLQREIDELLGGIGQIAVQTGINGGEAVVISESKDGTGYYGGQSLLAAGADGKDLSAYAVEQDAENTSNLQEEAEEASLLRPSGEEAPANGEINRKDGAEIYISTPTDVYYQNMQVRPGLKTSVKEAEEAQKSNPFFFNKALDHLTFDDAKLLEAMESSSDKDEDRKASETKEKSTQTDTGDNLIDESHGFIASAAAEQDLTEKVEASERSILIGGTTLNDLFPPGEDGKQNLSVRTKEDAAKFLEAVNQADEYLLHTQAQISSAAQMMGYDIDNLTTQYEALTQAYSTIADADMAKETVLFVKHKLSSQAALGMLRQTNQLPENALYLLS